MRAILIACLSAEDQRETDNSLPAQVVRLEKYYQTNGFEVIQTLSFGRKCLS